MAKKIGILIAIAVALVVVLFTPLSTINKVVAVAVLAVGGYVVWTTDANKLNSEDQE